MVWVPTVGTFVKVNDSAGKIQHARVTAVTDATVGAEVLTVVVGSDGDQTTIAGLTRDTTYPSAVSTWWHGRN